MESLVFEKDITVHCITAKSFPDHVKDAHVALHNKITFSPQRKYFGISWWAAENKIIYKAGASELHEGELQKLNLESRVIRKGTYKVITVYNFMKDIPAIGNAFETLGADMTIDEDRMAVEWYYNESDVRCMVRMK